MTGGGPTEDDLRRLLLGQSGPYANPHDAVDTLDNLAELLRNAVDHRAVARTLLELVTDSDPVVATGAVLGLRQVRVALDPSAVLDLATSGDLSLVRRPTGFTAAQHPTIAAELAHLVVSLDHVDRETLGPRFEALLDRPPGGTSSAALAADLVTTMPHLVLARARDWFGNDAAAVISRARDHRVRWGLATTARPWTDAARQAVTLAASWQHWVDADRDVLLLVMADDPASGEPSRILRPADDAVAAQGSRWWVVAVPNWETTLWRSDTGVWAVDVMDTWYVEHSHVPSDDEVAAILATRYRAP